MISSWPNAAFIILSNYLINKTFNNDKMKDIFCGFSLLWYNIYVDIVGLLDKFKMRGVVIVNKINRWFSD